MENLNNHRYDRAKERVENIKSFYMNLATYILVISLLAYINYRTTSFAWVLFPAVGWGMGVIGHGLTAFGNNPIFGKEWERRKIEELMNDKEF